MSEPVTGPGSGAEASSPSAANTPKPKSKRRLVAGVAIGVVALALAIPAALTATPRQCASCHEMRPYYDSWQSSSHRAAASNCLICHVKPGLINVVGFELSFYHMIAAHFAGSKVDTTTANAPSVDSCLRPECHSLNRETSNAGDIKIDHRLHVMQAKIPCTKCHPGAVHAGVNGRLKLPPMKLCKNCHADKMQQCSYCHTEQRLGGVPSGVH